MAARQQIDVVGLKQFRAALKKLGPEWIKELRLANLEAAKVGASASKAAAQGMGSVQAKAAKAIRPGADRYQGRIVVTGGAATPYALGAFLGSVRYHQFPAWVGNSWEPGGPGGPYAINPALRAKEDEIIDTYGQAVDRVMRAAFPD